MTDGPCAVVAGAELNGLGVVRSLARGGVPTIVLDTTYGRAAMWSRFARPVIVEELYGRKLVDGLLALQRGLDHRPALLLADEMVVHTVSMHREELKRAYQFQLPSPDTVKVLDNKARFHEFAERHGLPVPRSIVVSRVSDLEKLGDLRFPVIVKPADKRLVYLRRTQRLHMPADIEEARELCRTLLQTVGEFVVQEWIDGPVSNIYFCLFYRGDDRARTIFFSGRKILSHPPTAGSTALCIAAPEVAGQLEPFTAAFIERCDYRGLGSLEFKWDEARRHIRCDRADRRADGLAGRSGDAERRQHSAFCLSRPDRLAQQPAGLPFATCCLAGILAPLERPVRSKDSSAYPRRLLAP